MAFEDVKMDIASNFHYGQLEHAEMTSLILMSIVTVTLVVQQTVCLPQTLLLDFHYLQTDFIGNALL